MTAKRLGAFVIAVALVIGAILLRNALDDSSADSPTTDRPSGGPYQLVCSTEFASVCKTISDDGVTVVVEPAGVTLDRLAATDDDVLPDAWLTLEPFPAMLDETRDRTTSFGTAIKTMQLIAVTDQTFVAPTIKAEALAAACGTANIAGCVGARAGEAWSALGNDEIPDKVKPGIADPATEAIGLLALANGAAGFFGTLDFDPNDLRSDNDARTWLRAFARNAVVIGAGATPLSTMLVRDTKVDVAASSSAEVQASPRPLTDAYRVLVPNPAFELRAAWVVLGDDDDDDLRSKLASALDSAGWEIPGDGPTPLPASTFINLRTLWKDTR